MSRRSYTLHLRTAKPDPVLGQAQLAGSVVDAGEVTPGAECLEETAAPIAGLNILHGGPAASDDDFEIIDGDGEDDDMEDSDEEGDPWEEEEPDEDNLGPEDGEDVVDETAAAQFGYDEL